MTTADWKGLFRQFDRNRSLAGQQDRALYCEREEQDPADSMRDHFRVACLNGVPRTAFLTGHRGSGKTSSLLRLSQSLISDFFPVYTDVGYHLDTTRTHLLDLLWLLGLTLISAAEREGITGLDKGLMRELERSLATMTTKETQKSGQSLDWAQLARGVLAITASQFGGELGKQLADKVLKPFAISSGIEASIARSREMEPKINEVLTRLNLLIEALEEQTGKPLLLIVDGLDKLPGLDQAQAMFLESAALVGLACSVVYTIPFSLYTDTRFRQRESEVGAGFVLPNIKLYDRYGHDHEPGYKFMTNLVACRLQAIGLSPLHVMNEAQLRRLAKASGGVVRDFVGLVQDSLTSAYGVGELPLKDSHLARAIDDTRRALTSRLTQEFKEELLAIRKNHLPSGNETSLRLIHGMLALAFTNGDTWYDAHPLLWDSLT